MANVFTLQMQDASEELPSFEDFWALQVRKVGKKDAVKEWDKLNAEKQSLAVVGSAEWRTVWLSRGEMQYVPHPATWLRGERWDDELPPEFRPKIPTREIRPEDKGKYVPIPDSVKALIAKLRAK